MEFSDLKIDSDLEVIKCSLGTILVSTLEDDDNHIELDFYLRNKTPKSWIGAVEITSYKSKNDFIYGLIVDKKHRRRGYGKFIMQYIMNRYPVQYLNVAKDNMIAQNLYTKLGFKINCEVRMDNGEIMWQMKLH